MEILVFIKTNYHEYDCFAIIRKDLLEDLRYILENCYYDGKIALQVEYTKATNISLDTYDFFRYKLEDLCLGNDDSDFDNPDKIKNSLIKLAEYYNVDCNYDFQLIYTP